MLTAKHRKDYRPLDFKILTTDLRVELNEPMTRVHARLQMAQVNPEVNKFTLDGQKLELESLRVNSQEFNAYELKTLPGKEGFQELTVDVSSLSAEQRANFALEIVNTFNLTDNHSLAGIYKAGDIICSQCEAEGFRRITFFFDRPDCLSVYTVRVEAGKEFPYLLSNGNPQGAGELADGRHYAEWHDPFPKPSYLFALCSGEFDVIEDYFTTMSGRKVTLRLFCELGKKDGLYFAMEALKRAMKWDEERFGLEYDLDLFMIVAVSRFNMGAMENKGLNIFNDRCLVGSKDDSEDSTLANIDRIVAHEYFHNWTGDRVTCRDWFQLTLKEGLTVFRDQEYSSDHFDRDERRLADSTLVQTSQFAQDASPLSHPIRPETVLSQDNFYTLTVYRKGSEVIRMIHTLLGEEKFQAGMRLYFQRHDGQAVTCDDFVAAMQDASGIDLTYFKNWYSQSGTPNVTVTTEYDAAARVFKLHFAQHTAPTRDQAEKIPLTLLLKTHFYDRNTGARLTDLVDVDGNPVPELITFETAEHTVTIANLDAAPIFATNLDFSSPVRVHYDYSLSDLEFLACNSQNTYGRKQAFNQLFKHAFGAMLEAGEFKADEVLFRALGKLLSQAHDKPNLTAKVLGMPLSELTSLFTSNLDPLALYNYYQQFRKEVALRFSARLQELFAQLPVCAYEFNVEGMNHRALRNEVVALLALVSAQAENLLVEYFEQADNYTERMGAFRANFAGPQSDKVTDMFVRMYGDHATSRDTLLAYQVRYAHSIAEVKEVFDSIDMTNPNSVKALASALTVNAPLMYNEDFAGAEFIADLALQADAYNPQLASKLAQDLTNTASFTPAYQTRYRKVLERIANHAEPLSPNLSEVVNSCLAA